MWYALQCEKGQEESCLEICKEQLNKAILQNAFVITYEKMRRYEGDWHREKANLFPEHIILETEDSTALQKEMENLPIIYKSLRLIPEEEQNFLQELCDQNHHLPMSRGVIHGGITRVTEGPLIGHESLFRKIDRHKRLVFLINTDQSLCGDVKVGLEIVEKSVKSAIR